VKDIQKCKRVLRSSYIAFVNLIILSCAISVCAQSAPTEAEAMNRRLSRARALTAAHNLTAAAFELDSIRTSTTDVMIRDVARIMLIGIYLEQADYGRAQVLLDDTYKERSSANEGSCRSYFAVAGQAVNGVRSHIDRFRGLGLNVGSKDLPAEAVSDLDRVRGLLEHVAEQAKAIGSEDTKNTDAFALLEDVANVRSSLARNGEEREHWQDEVSEARRHLAASETRIASLSGGIGMSGPASTAAPAKSIPVSGTATTEPKPPVTSKPGNPESENKSSSPIESNDLKSTAATAELINIGSLLELAAQRVNPTYPTFAKTAHVTGVVRVDLVIDENGSVVSAQSATGPSVLRQAAIDASKRWKFRPTIRDGKPIRVTGFLNFNFTPQK
jgi:TonB family protein